MNMKRNRYSLDIDTSLPLSKLNVEKLSGMPEFVNYVSSEHSLWR